MHHLCTHVPRHHRYPCFFTSLLFHSSQIHRSSRTQGLYCCLPASLCCALHLRMSQRKIRDKPPEALKISGSNAHRSQDWSVPNLRECWTLCSDGYRKQNIMLTMLTLFNLFIFLERYYVRFKGRNGQEHSQT